jgi:hypothetical protein
MLSVVVVSTFLTTIHNNSSSSSSSSSKLVLGLIQTHGIPMSFLHRPDWKMEIREMEEVMITRDSNGRRLLLAERLQGTGFYLLIVH